LNPLWAYQGLSGYRLERVWINVCSGIFIQPPSPPPPPHPLPSLPPSTPPSLQPLETFSLLLFIYLIPFFQKIFLNLAEAEFLDVIGTKVFINTAPIPLPFSTTPRPFNQWKLFPCFFLYLAPFFSKNILEPCRGRIHGRNRDKSPKVFLLAIHNHLY
jgi:hypothetical protein